MITPVNIWIIIIIVKNDYLNFQFSKIYELFFSESGEFIQINFLRIRQVLWISFFVLVGDNEWIGQFKITQFTILVNLIFNLPNSLQAYSNRANRFFANLQIYAISANRLWTIKTMRFGSVWFYANFVKWANLTMQIGSIWFYANFVNWANFIWINPLV